MWDTHPASATSGRLAVAPGYERGWLTLERVDASAGELAPRKLRIAPIPDGWADLPDDELLRLMSDAALARPQPSA